MAGQIWVTDSLGGYMYADELSKELRQAVQPLVKFRQFADAQDGINKGLNKGSLFHWDVYLDIAAQGTSLVETSTMPESNFTITQGTITVNEFGNSVPFTAKLDNLSEHPVKAVINKVLKNDAKKAFDIQAHAQFDATPLKFVATTASDAGTLYTDGTATGSNAIALGKGHVQVISDTMKERNIPPFSMDDYFCIGHPTTFRTFKNDMETIHTNVGADAGLTRIMNGEIGRYEGFRFIEQTHISKANMTIPGAFGGAASNGAFFFGSDTVAECIAIPEEIRGKIPTDYGRSRGVAWYYLGGFGLVHTAAAQARIIAWDSGT